MVWNLAAEIISGIVVGIIVCYSYGSSAIPNVKNQVFQYCILVTFLAILFNIASTFMIGGGERVPLFLTQLVTTLYFFLTPLMSMVYLFYIAATAYEGRSGLKRVLMISAIPYAFYFLIVLTNPFTEWIFQMRTPGEYIRGDLKVLPYMVFYIYCSICFALIFWNKKYIAPKIRAILYAFPAIAVLVVFIQQLMPSYILSGSAAACALLIIYLYLQNKRITMEPVTGLLNRQAFVSMLELGTRRREGMLVAMISLANFRFIRDKFGLHNSEKFIITICEYLKGEVLMGSIYRYETDEFTIVFHNPDVEKVRKLLNELTERFSQVWEVEGLSCKISAGIGLVRYPEVASTEEEIIAAIEYAANCAKEKGRTDWVKCDTDMISAIKRRKRIEAALRKEIENNGFEVYYQPILDVKSNQFNMAEALLRMTDEELGAVSPAEFIPIAEESGFIVEMSYIVLNKVCKFIKDTEEQGGHIGGISVNLSVLHFLQENMVEKIVEIIEHYDVSPEKIRMEITESVLASDFEVVRDSICRMEARGILFGLDDFGTGYSNISNLFELPFHAVKIDKSLVWGSMENEKCRRLVESVTSVFQEMGMKVLMEGVETEAQADFVKNAGGDLIQGYLYARPMPAGDAMNYFLLGSDQSI